MSWDVPGLHDAPVAHDRDAVAEAQRLVEVVAHEQDGLLHARLQREQLVLQLVADQRVERREGLVHQEDVGVRGERAGEPHALLHAARQLADGAVPPVREADQFELALHDALQLGGRFAAQLEPEPDVLRDRAPGQQAELLEHHRDPQPAQAAEVLRAAARHVHRAVGVGDQHLPARHGIEAVGGAQERRLARAREAHHHADLAGRDREARARDAEDHAAFRGDLVPRRRPHRASRAPRRSSARPSCRARAGTGCRRP